MYLSPSLAGKILAALLLLFGLLALILSANIPLGESPDEYAHFKYIQFIAKHGRPPTNMAEREVVGYRAKWPPLYQVLAAPIVRLTESEGSTSLRAVNAGSRPLIALDGQASMAFLHTDDETFPFLGIARTWHTARLFSAALGVGTLALLFLSLRGFFSAGYSLAVMAVAAFTPTFISISAALNDDNLLGFLSALFVWLLLPLAWSGAQHNRKLWRYLLLGIAAGLAMNTKYSAIGMPLALIWLHILMKRAPSWKQTAAFWGGYAPVVGWWIIFVTRHFNRITEFGLLKGFAAPFLTGGTDRSTRQIAALIGVGSFQDAPAGGDLAWGEWLHTLVKTIWLPDIPLASWLWLPVIVLVIFALVGLVFALRAGQKRPEITDFQVSTRIILFLAGYVLLYLPLPALRFILTHSVPETAQGRHILFPALVPLALLPAIGLRYLFNRRAAGGVLASLALFNLLVLVTVVWPKITLADFPPLPVRSSLTGAPQLLADADLGDGVYLLGFDFPPGADPNALPLTLIWQAKDTPSADYTTQLQLQNQDGKLLGVWQGQPVNGRYPTRAWNKGDVIYDTVWLPVLPGAPVESLTLSVELRAGADGDGQVRTFSLPDDFRNQLNALRRPAVAQFEAQLLPRGDRFTADDPYRYRSTIPLSLNIPVSPKNVALLAPDGQRYPPAILLSGRHNAVALFNVAWTWPSGDYTLLLLDESGRPKRTLEKIARVWNRQRLLEAPPIAHPLNATYGNDQFELLGYDLPTNRVQPGESFEATLYWKALRTTNTSYKVFNHLLDSTGTQYGGRDRLPQGYYSTILWNPGEIIVDSYPVPVFSNAPAGIYWLDVGLYPAADPTAPSLPVVENIANSVRLGPVKVGGQPAASRPPSPPPTPRREQFGDCIALTGYSMALKPEANILTLNLYWEAIAPPPIDYTLFIHIIDRTGEVVAQADGPPVNGLYPTSFWDVDEQIFDSRQISGNNLPPGRYQIRLGWYDPASGQRLFVPGNPEGFVVLDTFEGKRSAPSP